MKICFSRGDFDLCFWLKQTLIAIDQFLNAALAPLLNLLVKEGGDLFGSADETLSSVMGKNSRRETCPVCRFICRRILHPIDRNHCEESIEIDEGVK